MLNNWLVEPKHINTKLCNLSSKDAMSIGKSFAWTLNDRRSAEAGAYLWIHDFPALVELGEKEKFFGPMVVTMGKRKLVQAPWGLIFQVGSGAVLSVLDVGTDLYSVWMFTQQKEYTFAFAVIAMISVSMFTQLLFMLAIGKKKSAKEIGKEALIVISGFKPVVDAYRVVIGVKGGEHSGIDPMFEMTVSKILEM